MNFKILVLALFFGLVFAQEETEVEEFSGDSMKKNETRFYIGLQGSVMGDWKLNEQFRSIDFSEIPNQGLEFTMGLKYTGEEYTIDSEFGFMANNKQNTNFKTNLMSSAIRLKFGKLLFNTEGFHLTTGLQASFNFNEIDVTEKNQVVDINNLSTLTMPSQLRLRNNMLAAGPMIGFGFGKIAKKSIRFYAAYEHGLTRGRWKSDYYSVLNTVQEQGQGRWLFGITL